MTTTKTIHGYFSSSRSIVAGEEEDERPPPLPSSVKVALAKSDEAVQIALVVGLRTIVRVSKMNLEGNRGLEDQKSWFCPTDSGLAVEATRNLVEFVVVSLVAVLLEKKVVGLGLVQPPSMMSHSLGIPDHRAVVAHCTASTDYCPIRVTVHLGPQCLDTDFYLDSISDSQLIVSSSNPTASKFLAHNYLTFIHVPSATAQSS
ncbi:uncharacterized protein A4U43_C05F24800 [Asparagus officinalis]|uniref:Uncharacterized protein n=1 Tax=Asparagus officinalis TaxID=4686 RepID=A0A5P1EUF0_ASPOF|nr:uncharacterized protein A4U43_C05F24800 [Asparagus officinalis]